jgi:hypothetical protein
MPSSRTLSIESALAVRWAQSREGFRPPTATEKATQRRHESESAWRESPCVFDGNLLPLFPLRRSTANLSLYVRALLSACGHSPSGSAVELTPCGKGLKDGQIFCKIKRGYKWLWMAQKVGVRMRQKLARVESDRMWINGQTIVEI